MQAQALNKHKKAKSRNVTLVKPLQKTHSHINYQPEVYNSIHKLMDYTVRSNNSVSRSRGDQLAIPTSKDMSATTRFDSSTSLRSTNKLSKSQSKLLEINLPTFLSPSSKTTQRALFHKNQPIFASNKQSCDVTITESKFEE